MNDSAAVRADELPRLIELLGPGIDISIPLRFNGPQPNAYGVATAASEPCAAGELVGDTRRGGSCNFEQYTLIPHCNGTHTECVGHITRERISITDCLKDTFVLSRLVSIMPQSAATAGETYDVAFGHGDELITRFALEAALAGSSVPPALIIRTLPIDESKLTRQYDDPVPPYFSSEAMQLIADAGVMHLLVDLPSIDRLYDEGKLSNHRRFWNVAFASSEIGPATRMNNTVTELIYVPESLEDGDYLLNLQIAPFAADASPSRPLLFPLG